MIAPVAECPRIWHHRDDPGLRAREKALLEALGAEVSVLGQIEDFARELDDPGADLALVEADGPAQPLARLLEALERLETATGDELPLIVVARAQDVPRLSRRMAARSHAVLLADPFEAAELVSAVRSALALRARQRDLKILTNRLRQADEELDRLRREAQAEARRRTQFLAAVSHDLRTPIHEISLACEVVQAAATDPPLPIDWGRLTEGLLNGVRTLRELVEDLFDMARLDLGTLELREAAFPLEMFLAAVLAPARAEAEARNLAFVVENQRPGAILRTDPDRLARVMRNLTSNAVKFTARGEIRVVVREAPVLGLEVSVIDTGRGIAPEALGTIFDEFAQLHNPERDRAKGSGLGLAISRRLIESLGGSIEVRSAPGLGSTFTMTVPGVVVADRTDPTVGG